MHDSSAVYEYYTISLSLQIVDQAGQLLVLAIFCIFLSPNSPKLLIII